MDNEENIKNVLWFKVVSISTNVPVFYLCRKKGNGTCAVGNKDVSEGTPRITVSTVEGTVLILGTEGINGNGKKVLDLFTHNVW